MSTDKHPSPEDHLPSKSVARSRTRHAQQPDPLHGSTAVSHESAVPSLDTPDDPVERFRHFTRKRAWIVALMIGLGALVGLALNLFLPRLYTARASLEVSEDRSSEFHLEPSAVVGVSAVDNAKLDTEIEILRSRSLAMEVIRILHLDSNPQFAPPPDLGKWDLDQPQARGELYARFLRNVTVTRLGHTHIIMIHVTSRRPELASLIANTLIDVYIEHTYRDNYAATAKISTWLDSQLGGLKDKLQKSQSRMMELQQDIGIVGLDQTQNITLANLEELNRQFAAAQVDRLVKEARYRAIQGSSPEVVDALAGQDPALQTMKATLVQLRDEYTSVTQSFGAGYPKVRELKAQIDQLQASLTAEEAAEVARARKEFEAAQSNQTMLRETLRASEQDAYSHGQKAVQYELARRDYEANRLLYDGVQQRLQEAGITAGLHSSAVHVVDNADIPVRPSQPRRILNLVAASGAGLLLGLGLALLLESLDTKLKTISDIEKGLQLPLLAAIPAVSPADLRPATFHRQAFAKQETSWPRVAESLRSLRTSLLLTAGSSRRKVIMMTSSRPAEGKTSVSCMVAITLALSGARTLLIDADLRRPSVHTRFGIKNLVGLSSVLSGAANSSEAVSPWGELDNLFVMPSGPVPPLPSELLGSRQLKDLISRLRRDYDHIVIDTPPVLTVTDAAVIGRLADAAILIVRYGEVQRPVVLRGLHILHRAGARLLGVAVNAVNLDATEYAAYYGRKHYRYRDTHTEQNHAASAKSVGAADHER